jgi:hypothetical protein
MSLRRVGLASSRLVGRATAVFQVRLKARRDPAGVWQATAAAGWHGLTATSATALSVQ